MLHDITIIILLCWKPILGLILTFSLLFLLFKNTITNLFIRIFISFLIAALVVFVITLYIFSDGNWNYG